MASNIKISQSQVHSIFLFCSFLYLFPLLSARLFFIYQCANTSHHLALLSFPFFPPLVTIEFQNQLMKQQDETYSIFCYRFHWPRGVVVWLAHLIYQHLSMPRPTMIVMVLFIAFTVFVKNATCHPPTHLDLFRPMVFGVDPLDYTPLFNPRSYILWTYFILVALRVVRLCIFCAPRCTSLCLLWFAVFYSFSLYSNGILYFLFSFLL